jgi:hypothetical protein
VRGFPRDLRNSVELCLAKALCGGQCPPSPVKVTHKILIQVTISHLLSLCSLRTLRFKSHLFNRRGAEYTEVRGERAINFLKFSPTLTGLALPTLPTNY